jgi:hypothetical protein
MSARSVTGTPGTGSPPPSVPDEPATPAGPVARAEVSLERIDIEVAAAKGSAGDGIEVAVFAGSIQSTSQQTTLEARMFNVEVKSKDGHQKATLENFSAKVTSGHQNSDGSVGGNFGIGATVIGVEGTVGHSGTTVTGGLAVGAGAELSVGTRDLDKDGSKELCARVSVGLVTLGLCLENPL